MRAVERLETKEKSRNRRRERGRERGPGSDELGSLPGDHRLSAMFTLTALSPPAPNPEKLPAGDQYPGPREHGQEAPASEAEMLRLDHNRGGKG